MKRKLAFTSLFLLITLSLPLSLFSQDFEMNGTVLVKYNGNAANVTIPAGVTAIGERAFSSNYSLVSITISSSVTSIGNGAFIFCDDLTSVIIPSSVTSIGESAFSFCRKLTSITIPSSVTSIGDFAFAWCGSLTTINVDNQNRAYSSAEGVLFNKNRTVLISYPAGKQGNTYTIPSTVTSIGNRAFTSCYGLASITIPLSVTSIGDNAFEGCNLTSVTIPAGVTSIGDGAFYECSSLDSVTVDVQNRVYSSADGVLFNKNKTVLIKYPTGRQGINYTIPSGVISIVDNAFYKCSDLTSVTIPVGVTSIGNNAFAWCYGLISVTIPAGLTSIGDNAFSGCSLTSVTIPAGVTSIGDEAFRWCESLTSVRLSRKTTMGINAFPDTVRIIYSD